MQGEPTLDHPWGSTAAIGLLKLPGSTAGHQYLFVCIHHLSRYVILAPLRDKSALSVARVLVDKVISPFTTPRLILSDNGAEFINELIADICTAFNIQQTFIVAHHPASTGLVQTANRKILEALRHVTNGLAHAWDG